MAVDPNAVCTEEACCICFESPIREPTRTKCNHWFCWYATQVHTCVLLVEEHCHTLFDMREVSFPVSMFSGNALSSTATVSALHCATAATVDSARDQVCCHLIVRVDAALPCLGHRAVHKTHETASCLLCLARKLTV